VERIRLLEEGAAQSFAAAANLQDAAITDKENQPSPISPVVVIQKSTQLVREAKALTSPEASGKYLDFPPCNHCEGVQINI
jgi:hypothetical protein